MTGTMEVVVVKRNGFAHGELIQHHEWQVSQGGQGRLPGPAEGGDEEGSERAGRGWHDTDFMGGLPRQPGGSAADRGQGVGMIYDEVYVRNLRLLKCIQKFIIDDFWIHFHFDCCLL